MNPRPVGHPLGTTEPYGALPHSVAATMLAVLDQRGPTITVRDVRDRTALPSTRTIHEALVTLRQCGLVDWEDGKKGTLHATCERVDVDGVPLSA